MTKSRAEWFRTASVLKEMDLLSKADRAAMAAYCVAYSRWVEAERLVKKYGMVVKSPDKGYPLKSPYLCIAESSLREMRKWLVEFGLTPSARTRVRVADCHSISKLDEFLEQRHA